MYAGSAHVYFVEVFIYMQFECIAQSELAKGLLCWPCLKEVFDIYLYMLFIHAPYYMKSAIFFPR